VKPGDTFLSDPIDGTPHLSIVVVDVPVTQEILVVSVTTYNDEKDPTCLLKVGDHPFIRHESCISYRNARRVSHVALQALIDHGRLISHERMCSSVLERIISGLDVSTSIPLGIIGWLQTHGLITKRPARVPQSPTHDP
jgi:hypothetical protein